MLWPAATLAGMPTIHLTDMARMRLDTISFFLMGLLLSAWGIQVLWNLLSADIPQLSRIRYSTSLAATVLWGLLFMLVLTMISGARELMTPGAWKKQGYTFKVDESSVPGSENDQDLDLLKERRERLALLRVMLWSYSATHAGEFPKSIEGSEIAPELWQQPGPTPIIYGYHAIDRTVAPQPLVFERDVYGQGSQFILMSDGAIMEKSTRQTMLATVP